MISAKALIELKLQISIILSAAFWKFIQEWYVWKKNVMTKKIQEKMCKIINRLLNNK